MWWRDALAAVMDLCYPGVCAVCRDDAPGDVPWCDACLNQLEKLEQSPACERCGAPLTEPDAPCPRCLGKGLSPFARVLRLASYTDPLKPLIQQMKYRGQWALAERLAERLFAQATVRSTLAECDGLVAVPLHPWRRLMRGYNQSHLLAKRLGRLSGRPVLKPAVRLRHTPSQTLRHSHASRSENLRDAFGLLRPQAIAGKRIVIVDDVMTSGATLQSLGRLLRQARPLRLEALVLAVADPRGADFTTI